MGAQQILIAPAGGFRARKSADISNGGARQQLSARHSGARLLARAMVRNCAPENPYAGTVVVLKIG
jgi:hypothetical protein